MINQIKSELKTFVKTVCEENGICAKIDESIDVGDYAVVKVDDYYNSGAGGNPIPPSIDCLITVKNDDDSIIHYLIELKNIKKASFTVSNIRGKFETTLYDFMGSKYSHLYQDPRFKTKDIKLYFVTDPYHLVEDGKAESGSPYDLTKLPQGNKMDLLLSGKPFRYRGKIYQIQARTPDPLVSKI